MSKHVNTNREINIHINKDEHKCKCIGAVEMFKPINANERICKYDIHT